MEQEQSCSFGGLCLDLSRRPVQCRLKSGVGDLLGFGQGLLLLFLLFKWRDKSKQYSPPKIGSWRHFNFEDGTGNLSKSRQEDERCGLR